MKRGPQNEIEADKIAVKRPSNSIIDLTIPKLTIDEIPSQIIKDTLFPVLDHKTLFMFAATCKSNANSYEVEVNKRASDLLLDSVVRGNADKARQIIQSKPELLYDKDSSAIDYSDRLRKDLTPFQAALCDGDNNMCEMMKEVGFSQFKDGQDKLKAQLDEIFPHGIDEHLKEQEKNVFDFDAILQAIRNSSNAEVTAALNKNFNPDINPLHKALDSFREQFREKSLSETVFNPFHLKKALKIYDGEVAVLGEDKAILFWRQVIGYTQRYLPACYAQVFAQGITKVVEGKVTLSRSLIFSSSNDVFYPLSDLSGVGFDFAGPDTIEGPSRNGVAAHDYWTGYLTKLFSKLISEKNNKIETLLQQKACTTCIIQ